MTKCPICGYNEIHPSKIPNNIMNHYVDPKNPQDVVLLNNDAKEVTIGKDEKAQLYIRQDVYEAGKTLGKRPPIDSAAIKSPTSPILTQAPEPVVVAASKSASIVVTSTATIPAIIETKQP